MPRPAELHARAGLKLLARMHERIPSIFVQIGQKQALNGPAAWQPRPQKAGRKNLGVVDDEEVTFTKKLREPTDGGVLDFTARFVQDKQPRHASLRRRDLRDEPLRQIEVEI